MKLFIKRSFLFIICIPFIYILFYFSLDYYFNIKNDKNAIFIWGDSQAYQGIDIKTLSDKTNKKVYTYAKHGAGIYDFLVFTQKIKKNATVVLGISKPVQLRKKESDRNLSGISISSLIDLHDNGYSYQEIKSIIQKNKKPIKVLQEKTYLYKYCDTIIFSEPLEVFEEVYEKAPTYLENKQHLYKIGIETLRKKECNIIFLDFPYHHLLKTIENKSVIKAKTKYFSESIISSSVNIEVDTVLLDTNKQLMHDLTHLNEYGAKQVSIITAKHINKSFIEKNKPFEVYIKLNN